MPIVIIIERLLLNYNVPSCYDPKVTKNLLVFVEDGALDLTVGV